jgi:ribosomal protein S27E
LINDIQLSSTTIAIYCKVCGSLLFQPEAITKTNESNKGYKLNASIDPSAAFGIPSAIKIGGELDKRRKTQTVSFYETKVCMECQNEQMFDSYTRFNPIRAYPATFVSARTKHEITKTRIMSPLVKAGKRKKKSTRTFRSIFTRPLWKRSEKKSKGKTSKYKGKISSTRKR